MLGMVSRSCMMWEYGYYSILVKIFGEGKVRLPMVNGEWWMVNHDDSRFSFRKRKAQALPTRSVSFREDRSDVSTPPSMQASLAWRASTPCRANCPRGASSPTASMAFPISMSPPNCRPAAAPWSPTLGAAQVFARSRMDAARRPRWALAPLTGFPWRRAAAPWIRV